MTQITPPAPTSGAPSSGHIWRPPARIRVKAFGLHWKESCLLAAPIVTDDGTPVGVRPLGGSLTFGEPWQDALRREFQEELGVTLATIARPRVIENIFTHGGALGHEIVFVADVTFADGAYADGDSLTFTESDGMQHVARWYDLRAIRAGDHRLLPTALETLLLRQEGL
ncbi:NUDIX hydrolase [Marivita sp. S0852]|uniref:NUDIX hydrolase n=1 Tax=Marivita sp. S0852 TaxID=3373893 RepID=UPI0039828016